METEGDQPQASIRVGMAQMRVLAGQARQNLQKAVEFIERAAQAGCDLVVLPECLDIGWGDPRAQALAQPLPGAHLQPLADAARQHRIHVAAGLVERCGERLYNAAVLLDDTGALQLHHRKINELSVLDGLYATGDRLGVAHTRLGVIGLSICADNLPESLAIGEVLARMGAQLIVSPCAWAVPPEHDNALTPYGSLWRGAYGELARRFGLPVVGVSNVGCVEQGAWAGNTVIGCSLAMGGDGRVLAQGPYGVDAETLLTVELPLRAEASLVAS